MILSEKFLKKYENKQPNWGYNSLGYIVYKRTYSRVMDNGKNEEWCNTVARCVEGAQDIGADYTQEEAERLYDYVFNLKCNFAGRMLWQLGTNNVKRFGGNSLLNCWAVSITKIEDFCFLFENLMLGGGVGFSVKREDIHELPRVKRSVSITNKNTKDADFIVPDSREGWVNLLRKVLRSYFETSKSFSYSTILVRGYGEVIKSFGGVASGPQILVEGIEKICTILKSREGKKLRSIDALDVCNIIASIVVSGNVRRSATIALGDSDDYLFLRAKRWDLGDVPSHRAMSNNTIIADSYDYITNDVWEGFKGNGEPYGLFNIGLSQKYGRIGDRIKDNCELLNPCFIGNTIIAVADGRNGVSIEQLAKESKGKKEFYVYSGKIKTSNIKTEIKKAIAFKSGTKEVIKVILSDNSEFECTPDHKLCLKNGEYKEAKDCYGLELSKFFTFSNKNSKKSYRIINSISNGYAKQYRMLWEIVNGKYDGTKFNIDHKDSNSTNDDIGNLRLISIGKHRNISSKSMQGSGNSCFKIKNTKNYSHNMAVSTTINNYLRAGKSREEINKILEKKNLHFVENVDENVYLNSPIFVKDVIFTGKIEDVYDLTVEGNNNFYIITKTDDKKYLNCSGILVHNCGEITVESYECCNLCELYLNNITSLAEMIDCAKLLYKTQKAICALNFIHEETNEVVHKNMRIGIGVTGICQSLEKIEWFDKCYKEIRKFDKEWSKKKNYPESIKLTTIKPSGTLSLLSGSTPGVHPSFSKYYIRRVRMSSDDKLVKLCKDMGYKVEFNQAFDGTEDHKTTIVEFPCYAGENVVVAKDMSAVKQLELVKQMQTLWSDNAVSVTVYYKKEELNDIKEWLKLNYENNIKSVSFLLHSEHGFKQAPYEEITKEEYDLLIEKVKPLSTLKLDEDNHKSVEISECSSGACPIR
jgi:ribonucleotide reductase alpha subunit